MDPSEFEGTVERDEAALDAGALEHLLQDQGPKFVMFDLAKDMGDLYLSIYSLKETLTKFDDSSFGSLTKDMDAYALKLTELKEGYVNRRKLLTQEVKRFTNDYLSDESDEHPEFTEACKSIIALFKKEFDGLSTMSKFSENAFTNTYKELRDLPDPVQTATDALAICLKAHEVLGKAKDQLVNADLIINQSNTEAVTAPHSQVLKQQAEIDKLVHAHEMDREELRQSYMNEITNLRAEYDIEMRNRELNLTATFDRQQMELQRQTESALSKKDAEVASLLRSLNDHRDQNREAEERSKLLDAEMTRRRELEDKWRAAVISSSDLGAANQELQQTLAASRDEAASLQHKLANLLQSHASQAEEWKQQLCALQARNEQLSQALASRPPADLSHLLSALGGVSSISTDLSSSSSSSKKKQKANPHATRGKITDDHDDNGDNEDEEETTSGGGGVGPSWAKVEAFLLETLRKSDSDATASRVRCQEEARRAAELLAQCTTLQQQLKSQRDLAASLESELFLAHQAAVQPAPTPPTTVAAPSSSSSSTGRGVMAAVSAEHQHLQSLLGGSSASGGGAGGFAQRDCEGAEDEEGGGGAAATHNVNSRILQAVQSQRDRFMRASKEKDAELHGLRIQLEQLDDEQQKLRKENLELYRRLRVLRVTSGGAAGGGGGVAGAGGIGGGGISGGSVGSFYDSNARSRRGVGAGSAYDTTGGSSNISADFAWDDLELDRKYMSLYEAEISPFRVEEIDKQLMLSRLNIFERGLAYLNRYIMQDRWARHALLVYLALVHVFALAYVSKVLNPELIGEMDAHLKAKWSSETFSVEEHPDIE
jgi:hypothetical protein